MKDRKNEHGLNSTSENFRGIRNGWVLFFWFLTGFVEKGRHSSITIVSFFPCMLLLSSSNETRNLDAQHWTMKHVVSLPYRMIFESLLWKVIKLGSFELTWCVSLAPEVSQ